MSVTICPTAVIVVKSHSGQYLKVRALLDTGASVSVIKQSLVNHLKLHQQPNGNRIYGVGNQKINVPGSTVKLVVKPVGKQVPIISTKAIVMYSLTGNLPPYTVSLTDQLSSAGIVLADNKFNQAQDVDIILGTDILNYVFDGSKISTRIPGLSAYGSCFGHVIMGTAASNQQSSVDTSHHSVETSVEDYGLHATRLEEVLERFWKVEEAPSQPAVHPDHMECERLYTSTTQRTPDGKYMVRLPLLSERLSLGETRSSAIQRLRSLERKMAKNDVFAAKYRDFMKEYEDLGHMSLSRFQFDTEHFIIPHHGIFKKGTDKIRVVFDGSGRSSTGVSINQCLHTGQPLQNDITKILLNFRRHQIVFTTDIKMMFRMTWIHPEDRRYQLILWRENSSEEIKVYELNTNTYGLRSSPFISIRTLLQLADDWEATHPESPAVTIIRRDVFVDDILTGADSIPDAQWLKSELIQLMASAGYELRKWSSNCKELLQDLPQDHCESLHHFDSDETFIKVLGVQWDPSSDSMSYQINIPTGQAITKRSVLSTISRLYDPCGYCSPTIFRFKVFLQTLFSDGLNWDEPISQSHHQRWKDLIQDLVHLSSITFPRCVSLPDAVSHSLHGFGDASELGFASCVYLRTVDSSGNVMVRLLMSKSRVAPKKTTQTIPKLELSAAHLTFKLLNHVAESYEDSIELDSINAWSDSTIVLSWLNTKPHMLQTFECNRVQDIQNSKRTMTWRHIRSEYNPADVASRGMSAEDLLKSEIWWSPTWLHQAEDHWPHQPVIIPHKLPGFKKLVNNITPVESWEDTLLSRVSSYRTLINVTSFVLRFCRNIRLPKDQRNLQPNLSMEETRQATRHWIRRVQFDSYQDEFILIKRGKLVCKSLQKLSVFIDEDNFIRVGGRLRNSNLSYGAKHQYLIPKDHRWTQLLINYYHQSYCHAATNALMAILRRQYWIPSVRRQISKTIRNCLICFRFNTSIQPPFMSDLPADRVTAARPFSGVATDFAGPFLVKSSLLRNAKSVKAYLCVFVCLGTKAVHLEVVSGLTVEAFVASFTRFVSRRGLPSLVRSDRGTNFVGSDSYFKEINNFLSSNEIALKDELRKQSIRWEFNPPASPHMGGLFESAVKSAKNLLKREAGNTIFTFEELSTLFTKIESILNSRPLIPASNDPCDLEVLTPGHFIIGQPLVALPEPHWKDTKMSKLSRFQAIQKIFQSIWARWHIEYLNTLQSRNKWYTHVGNLELNDLVLIIDENSPPLQWRRGRVIELYHGSDKVVRSVKLKTQNGELIRPVVKLCKLPTQCDTGHS